MTALGRPPTPPEELDHLELLIDTWFTTQQAENDDILAVERGEPGQRRWYVRMAGEQKSVFAVWFTLHQRSLAYETYLLPAPEDNVAAVFEYLLRRSGAMYGATFAIGEEDAIYVVGELPNDHIDPVELDRILGTVYALTEDHFRPLLNLAFARRLGTGAS
jgi:hypothetical protein